MALPDDTSSPDVVIVGSGPNGLTAGVLLARAGLSVRIVEAADSPGGGCRSAQLTLPGFVHDICAAVHPMGALSPVFRDIRLERYGLQWVRSRAPLAHPLPDGGVAVLEHSLHATAQQLGADGRAWEQMLQPFADVEFVQSLLQPIWYLGGGSLLKKARFGLLALRSCQSVAQSHFRGDAARALFAGCAAHSVMALDRAGTASFGLVLAAVAHAIDWPCARGGSQAITSALVRAFESYGGVLQLGHRVTTLSELPNSRAILFDLSPHQVAQIAGDALPAGYRERLARFRHGPAVFKVDWALREPIPWRNAECRLATTVHVCGAYADVLRSESEATHGRAPERPFVLVAQQSLLDSTRAPAGQHTGWAYCHVPNGSTEDMTARIEAQVERFAPGFRDCILARHSISPSQLEAHNPTMVGGDMAGGQNDLGQFLFRPFPRLNPYTTPNPRLYLCSSSTPPGGGVHGMCGYHAASAVLRQLGIASNRLHARTDGFSAQPWSTSKT
jgi:phytoene dehydrogenase-like protein